ncbi:L-rhamnose mutarotase [Microbacteriaceae bacterium VKM Ac-2855]|nr:L-rhamnose mutarotase [Microbacteriaceae bacterium VKM Ac-2855]
MRRVAEVIALDPAGVTEYERIHAAAWPAVLARLTASHITNYSIYRYETLLFSYFEYRGTDLEADLALVAADPITQQWWQLCMPLQRPVAEVADGEWWHALPEVFHLD